MRNRLLIVLAVLAVLTTATFAIPLSVATAESRTREFILSREADVQRFAGLAENYVVAGGDEALDEELTSYTDLYAEPIAVVSTRGVAPRSTGLDLLSEEVQASISRAVRNQPNPTPPLLTPWSPDTVLFSQPIGNDAQVSGAVVLAASTADAKADIGRGWLATLAAAVAALLVFGVIAQTVSRWVLRPLQRLSARIRDLTAGLPFVPRSSPGPAGTLPTGGPPELRALTRSFDAMSAAVIESTAAQRRLVADTAHQLRNPLAALQLRLDVLENHVDADTRPSVERAAAEAERLNLILGDLLSLARAETPEVPNGAVCDAAAVAAERLEFWLPAASRSGSALTLHSPASAPVAVTAHTLEQILDVLIDNACKYAAGAQIDVGVEPKPGAATTVTVADHGPGVRGEHLDRLTERFFRGTDTADQAGAAGARPGGTGLGLSIAAALAERSGGSLRFRGTEDGGLTALLELPAAAATDARANDDGASGLSAYGTDQEGRLP
ncbi:sensor histidine kinase [Arthrobacter sp. USHLN218]|uniref:sensor histidine kinase n=1 Tax=Arthrobacter sp. USHLN218 TaxID=3081232 RepID=UPI00301A6B6E